MGSPLLEWEADDGAAGNWAPAAVEVVIVAYRSRPHVEQLLSGLPPDLPVVVVDNSDGSDGLGELVRARAGGRYLSGGGVGFARAANLGARTSSADVLVFVKPTVRPTAADLDALAGDVVADPRCAASAATLVHDDGRPQLGVGGWEPTLRRALVHSSGLHKLFPRAGIFARPRPGEEVHPEWVNGGVMAVRRDTFLALGGFDEDFYLFNEDMALGRASREAGLVQRLRADVVVRGVSGGSGAPALEMWRLRGAAMARYVRKYRPGLRSEIALAVLGLAHLLRSLVAFPRDRGMARQQHAQALGLLTGSGSMAGKVVMSRR